MSDDPVMPAMPDIPSDMAGLYYQAHVRFEEITDARPSLEATDEEIQVWVGQRINAEETLRQAREAVYAENRIRKRFVFMDELEAAQDAGDEVKEP